MGSPIWLVHLALSGASVCVWFVGLGFAITRWKRHPRVSTLTIVGLGLLCIGRGVTMLLPLVVGQSSSADFTSYVQMVQIASGSFSFLAWLCLLGAIFSGRQIVAPNRNEYLTADGKSSHETGNPYQSPH